MSWKNIISSLKVILIIINILIIVGLLITDYSGNVDPVTNPKIAVLGLSFPLFFIAELIFVLIWFIFQNLKLIIISIIPILFSFGEAYSYCPLNIWNSKPSEAQEKTKFTMLTYNVMDYLDFEQKKLDYNRTISEILKIDADIVCLQECYSFKANAINNFTKAQSDSLKARYPYQLNSKRDLGFLSKYPIEECTDIEKDNSEFGAAQYRLLINNEYITIFNVHLKSIGLTHDAKNLYYQLTEPDKAKEKIDSVETVLKEVKGELYSKLAKAMCERASQAHLLDFYIEGAGGNVILCGDFNDTPESYAYRQIKGDMTDAYRECGFGPAITYHDNRFYFRIDHIFYKGNFEATKVERFTPKCSDHYPLYVEFVKK
ncbi:MAG: endonuclease/exonuclease/phosphatase family protein [Muribaculaceae bacterium]|nr:endonuclease/exonuclease/phosphatase family protein [Muribaculaceae bacterium]